MRLRTLCLPAAGRGRVLRPLGVLTALAVTSSAHAQIFGGYNPCNPCRVVCAPCQTQATAMVIQPAYRTVPVTAYRQVQKTVMRPVTETKYVNRQVTHYRPVTETRTASVPVTTYKPVTTVRPVVQDRSYYQTRYVPNYMPSPCAYDPRPGLAGWLNRTGYQVRAAFTPRYTAYRQYVPNRVVMQVPTTHYVAQRASRQVTYNVTHYEAVTTTKRVPVTTTHMVAETHTVNQPVTTYRTVPVGTTVAYAPAGAVAFGGTVTSVAYGPIQYGAGATTTAALPDSNFKTIPSRTAENTAAPGKAPGKYDRGEAAKPNDGFGKPPESTDAHPFGPTFHRFTNADRRRVLRARRLSRQEQQGRDEHESALASAGSIGNFETAGLDDQPALAAAFQQADQSIKDTWQMPVVSGGPKLVAPQLATIQ